MYKYVLSINLTHEIQSILSSSPPPQIVLDQVDQGILQCHYRWKPNKFIQLGKLNKASSIVKQANIKSLNNLSILSNSTLLNYQVVFQKYRHNV